MIRFLAFFIASYVLLGSLTGLAQTKLATAPATPSKVTKPLWSELKPEQQTALLPLQVEWANISETQKRKWVAVSKNFGKLQADEQTKFHSRMKEWVALSPQQRAAARLNFSTAKTLTPEEKQKQWQAYQSLSPNDKQQLADKAKNNTPNSAALAHKSQNKTLPVSKLPPAVASPAPPATAGQPVAPSK